MSRDKYIQFQYANEYVINKDKALNSYIKYMLSRTQSMFSYSGLPDSIPQTKLEYILQTNGYAFVTEIEGVLYALTGDLGGELDVYNDFTQITVANTALKLTRTFDIATDGVLINNDTMRMGLLPILQKYGALLTENTISIRTVDIMLRMLSFISASDDKTHTSAEKFIKDIENGKISAIGESAFFDGVKIQSLANSQDYIRQFLDYEQYLKGSCFNEIGLNGNYNLKREYIGNAESALNDDFLLPLVDNMIKERETAIQAINEKYGTDINIGFASAWYVTHMENEKEVALSEVAIENSEVLQDDNSADEHKGSSEELEERSTEDNETGIEESEETSETGIEESEETSETEIEVESTDSEVIEDDLEETVKESSVIEDDTTESEETDDIKESEDKEDDS